MLRIEYRKTADLIPYANNARKHPQKQLQKLAANIKSIGFLVPILIDRQGVILAGHGRVEAAKMASLKEVPTILIDHLSEAQQRAFILADNRLSQDSSWDKEKLKGELEFLSEYDFELGLTAFDTSEIDLALGGEESIVAPEDEIEIPPPEYKPVTRTGDIWLLGNHRLMCGDSLKATTYQGLMLGESVGRGSQVCRT